MSNKSKVCRVVVVKIVDSGPITSNNTDTDESDIDGEQVLTQEPVIRHSPLQKRPISPVPTANMVNNKKLKVEPPPTNNIKKKQVPSIIKNENPTKKTKLVSHKSSSVVEEKPSKILPITELNQTMTVNKTTEISLLSKPRTSTKLTKSQSTTDIKPSIQSIANNTKKKEPTSSPSKVKPVISSQNGLKKPINKNPSIKTEQTSISTIKSPSNTIPKQEPSPQPSTTIVSSNTTTTSVSISNLKKIPKKLVPSSVVEKRSRLSMPSTSLNRNSIRDSQKQQAIPPKTQSKLKRDRSSSSVSNSSASQRSGKTNIVKSQPKHQSLNSSRHDQSNYPTSASNQQKQLTPIRSPSQPPVDSSQPTIISSPAVHIFRNEDNRVQDTDEQNNDDHIQLSNTSNSPQEPTTITSNRLFYSDQSDTNDGDISTDDDNEEEDLPTSLSNDDLRYKLIYIYKRFQLNSISDLIIFVHFFKRHHLIDTSSLSMTKTSNEMFTYDLFSLSPSHIIELASDLGYTTTNIINSMEQ